jgi:hypothetical protein
MRSGPIGKVRCAIYTRVSTDQGLDQDFNSLDAQYEAASAYIRSQAHASWTLIRSRYDDGGYSGGSTDRPNLQRLLDDVEVDDVVKASSGAIADATSRDGDGQMGLASPGRARGILPKNIRLKSSSSIRIIRARRARHCSEAGR